MAVFDDDPLAPPGKRSAHEIGEPLEAISVEELRERVGLLRAEIERLETTIKAKQASKDAAESFFKG